MWEVAGRHLTEAQDWERTSLEGLGLGWYLLVFNFKKRSKTKVILMKIHTLPKRRKKRPCKKPLTNRERSTTKM